MKPIIRDFADLAVATQRIWAEHPDYTPHQVSEALEAEYEISASVKGELTRQAVEKMTAEERALDQTASPETIAERVRERSKHPHEGHSRPVPYHLHVPPSR